MSNQLEIDNLKTIPPRSESSHALKICNIYYFLRLRREFQAKDDIESMKGIYPPDKLLSVFFLHCGHVLNFVFDVVESPPQIARLNWTYDSTHP